MSLYKDSVGIYHEQPTKKFAWSDAARAAAAESRHGGGSEDNMAAARDRMAAAGKSIQDNVYVGNPSGKAVSDGGKLSVGHNGTKIGDITQSKDGTFQAKHTYSGAVLGGHPSVQSAVNSLAGMHVSSGFAGSGGKNTKAATT